MTTTLNASTAGAGGFIATSDNSGVLALQTAGTTAITVDASQNVGIGTSSPQGKLDVSSSSAGVTAGDLVVDTTNKVVYVGRQSSTSGDNAKLVVRNRVGDALTITGDTSPDGTGLYRPTTSTLGFTTAGTERMRIDSSGAVFINATSAGSFSAGARLSVLGIDGEFASVVRAPTTSTYNVISLDNPNGQVGRIQTSGSATSFLTSSDYRLKEDITPMTGALAKVALLKPVTYKWKVDGTDGQGFIAHELQEVVPDCVGGNKDAVDANGNPQYQGIDTSFLVATLTAALQETKALLDTQAETINALTARIVAIESKP